MTAMSNSDFAKRMMLLARPAEQFEPTATYDPDGDCIEFLARPDPFYAERVDDLVTVYYSQESNEVVGSLIKGVRGFMANAFLPNHAGVHKGSRSKTGGSVWSTFSEPSFAPQEDRPERPCDTHLREAHSGSRRGASGGRDRDVLPA